MFLQDKALVHNSGETEGHGGTGGSSILAVIQIETNVIHGAPVYERYSLI